MNNQEYKEKCAELAAIYQEASITGKKFINKFSSDISSPNLVSKLDNWELEDDDPMKKYISLGLDMEFSDDNFETLEEIYIGKLTNIGDFYGKPSYRMNSRKNFYHCRLRPNHIHWWNRADANPIPEYYSFKIFSLLGNWSVFKDSNVSKNFAWNGAGNINGHSILAFLITYDGTGDNENG